MRQPEWRVVLSARTFPAACDVFDEGASDISLQFASLNMQPFGIVCHLGRGEIAVLVRSDFGMAEGK